MTGIAITYDAATKQQHIVIKIDECDIARLEADSFTRAFLAQPAEHPADWILAAEYVLRRVLPPFEKSAGQNKAEP